MWIPATIDVTTIVFRSFPPDIKDATNSTNSIFTNSEGNDYDEKVIDEVMTLIHQEFQKNK